MPVEISPASFQEAVQLGFKRNKRSVNARLHFLRQYVGQYYDKEQGSVGKEPLNLIYNAIRVLVPNLVFTYPTYTISSDYIAYRPYGDLLALALTKEAKRLKLRNTLRSCVVDAIFMMGILKTGMCDSGSAIHFDEDDSVDPGMIYTDRVDFANFVWDPFARSIDESLFQGDRILVPRKSLLESGLYKNELIEKLPAAYSDAADGKNSRVESLSAGDIDLEEAGRMEDMVEIVELWVPRANALITVPASREFKTADYLRVADYYGPDSGPYTKLVLTPPVPNNPMPISSVGIWSDLHHMANKMAVKVMDQAQRQKDILAYKPSAADDAEEIRDAGDGEAVAVDDPSSMNTISFGGQKNSNETHLNSLQSWFNMMSGNTEGLAGMSMNSKSATEAQYLASNAQATLSDMQDLVYIFVSEEASKRLWYRHTDPLMETPLAVTRRGDLGEDLGEVQVMLTPEIRRGDAIDYALEVEPESMGRTNASEKYQKALEFAVKVMPAAAQAAMVSMQMGTPFSFPAFITRMAKFAGIEWIDEVFKDPQLQMQNMVQMQMAPQLMDAKGQAGDGLSGIMQNGGSPMAGKVDGQGVQARQLAQNGANQSQASMAIREV